MSDPRPDFNDLMRRMDDGDESAVDELVRHYYEDIHRFVRLYLKHHPPLRCINDSIDFAQDAWKSFVRLLRGGRPFESEAELIALLRSIVVNKMKTSRRHHLGTAKRDLRRHQPLGKETERLADPAPGPEKRVTDRDLMEHLFNRLSAEEKLLFRLRFDQRCSYREMAEKLGWDERAVARRMTQILERVTSDVGVPILS